MQVSAVVTTGIYCRPGCSARPARRNVLQFPLPAAAEAAGYRACLRCRPYRLPQVTSGITSEQVCRAVRLVLAGILDEGTEETLAARLGVSARHLRRLFMTHLGVTPDGLARSARAHFARRLLDETDLTITEIAFAAGFGSLRQFNRVCREVFKAPPSDLRRRRRRSDRLVADGGLALRLAFHGPLDWPEMLAALAETAIPGVESVSGDAYRRTIVLGGDPGVLELLAGGKDHLILRAHLPHWEELLHVVRRARRIAGLDVAMEEPVLALRRDPVIGPLVRARPGVRAPGCWDPFEAGVRAIVRQSMPEPATNATMRRLVARHGTPVAGLRPFGLTHTFPGPDVLATADLAGIGMPAATATAIRVLAASTVNGTVRFDPGSTLDDLVHRLGALPGISPRTAHYVALRLGEMDAFPLSGRQLARRLAGLGPPPDAPLTAVVARWRPWRALAATHLWAATTTHPSVMQKGVA
ncbi:MAG: helix-turn-helix domain-containing protein [Micromonosporaceae bacterium]